MSAICQWLLQAGMWCYRARGPMFWCMWKPILWHRLLRKERVLLQGQQARRPEAGLKFVSKTCELFRFFQVSEDGLVCWRFPLEGFGTQPFMVKVVKGLWHSIFWYNQSFASERDLTVKFWSYLGPLVPRERWNFGCRYSVKIVSSAYVIAAWFMYLFSFL